VHGHFNADERAPFAPVRRRHDGVGDGVCELVGVAGQHEFGGADGLDGGHGVPPLSVVQWAARPSRSLRVLLPGVSATPSVHCESVRRARTPGMPT